MLFGSSAVNSCIEREACHVCVGATMVRRRNGYLEIPSGTSKNRHEQNRREGNAGRPSPIPARRPKEVNRKVYATCCMLCIHRPARVNSRPEDRKTFLARQGNTAPPSPDPMTCILLVAFIVAGRRERGRTAGRTPVTLDASNAVSRRLSRQSIRTTT